MAELRILLVFGLLFLGYFFLRALDPRWVLIGVLVLLQLINLAMMVISSVQGWRRNPRYLSGFSLGLIHSGVGLVLVLFITGVIGRWVNLAAWVGFPFMVGGGVVLLVSGLGALRPKPVRTKSGRQP